MTNISLAQSYVVKATKRLKILSVLLVEQAYSDVIREAQEIVELALKGLLRQAGIDPPKWHDVGTILEEQKRLFPAAVRKEIPRLTGISKWLRKERELSFYGDIDFIPTEEYTKKDALKAIRDADFVVRTVRKVVIIS
jgi:HEPN domain-containing protein